MASNPQIKAVITAEDRASATLSKFGNNVNGVSSKISKGLKLAAIGVAAAGTAAVAFGVSSVKSFQESEKATAQLNAVLKSTKGAAGVSAKAATNLADKLSLLNAVDDEAVLSAENMLLTFTNIGKNIFPQTTQAAIDMATAMNGGAIPSAEQLRNTTIQLGKALQSPDAGLGALKRVGVNVDELKKKFTESMTVQEKQKLILKELATEFGGSGAAAANTYAGKMNLIKIAFENLKEKIGLAILNGFNPLMTKLAEFVASDQFQAWITKLTTWLQVNLPIAINYVTNTLIPNLVNIFNAVWPVLQTVIGWFGKFINFLADHEVALWTFIGIVGAMKAAMLLDSTVKSVQSSLSILKTSLTSFNGFGLFAAAAVVAIVLVKTEMDKMAARVKTKLDEIMGKSNKAVGTMEQLNKDWKAGKINDKQYQDGLRRVVSTTGAAQVEAQSTLSKLQNSLLGSVTNAAEALGRYWKLPEIKKFVTGNAKATGTDFFAPRKYATGTGNASGGMALVGERGPEMVTLPRGSKVARADETRRMMGGSSVEVHVHVGMFAGSPMEIRKIATNIFQAFQDVATQNGVKPSVLLDNANGAMLR